MMTPTVRRAKQVDAAVALLQTFTPEQLQDVIKRLDVRGTVQVEQVEQHQRRVCGICRQPYTVCRRRALNTGDDHEFEPTTIK